MLENDLWLKHASHANSMATQISDGLQKISGVELTQKTEVNAVFLKLPPQQKNFFRIGPTSMSGNKKMKSVLWQAVKHPQRMWTKCLRGYVGL